MSAVADFRARASRAVVIVAATACAVAAGTLGSSAPAQADPSSTQVEQQLEKEWHQLEGVVEKYNRNQIELDKTKSQVNGLNHKLAPLRKRVDAMYARVGKLSAAAYKGGHASAVNALLSSGSPTTLVEQMGTLDVISRTQAESVKDAQKAKSAYDKQLAALNNAMAKQRQLERNLAAQKDSINKKMDQLQKQRATIIGAKTGQSPQSVPDYIPGKQGRVVGYAYAQLGDPYVWAAAGPDAFDCSGLTLAAWAAAGVYLPHNAAMQYDQIMHVSRGDLQPGDLVFWNGLSHVGLYVGNGKVIHAPQPGEGVKISGVDEPGSVYGFGRPG